VHLAGAAAVVGDHVELQGDDATATGRDGGLQEVLLGLTSEVPYSKALSTDAPMPIIPGPAWAPSTGPTSET
jgi:hypothetical protein